MQPGSLNRLAESDAGTIDGWRKSHRSRSCHVFRNPASFQFPPAFPEDPELGLFGDYRSRFPDVVILLANGPENRQAAMDEKGHIELQFWRHPPHQRQSTSQMAFRQI